MVAVHWRAAGTAISPSYHQPQQAQREPRQTPHPVTRLRAWSVSAIWRAAPPIRCVQSCPKRTAGEPLAAATAGFMQLAVAAPVGIRSMLEWKGVEPESRRPKAYWKEPVPGLSSSTERDLF